MSHPEKTYTIRLLGFPDVDREEAISGLESAFKVPTDRAEWFMDRIPVKVRSKANKGEARRFAQVLLKLGADIAIINNLTSERRLIKAADVRDEGSTSNETQSVFFELDLGAKDGGSDSEEEMTGPLETDALGSAASQEKPVTPVAFPPFFDSVAKVDTPASGDLPIVPRTKTPTSGHFAAASSGDPSDTIPDSLSSFDDLFPKRAESGPFGFASGGEPSPPSLTPFESHEAPPWEPTDNDKPAPLFGEWRSESADVEAISSGSADQDVIPLEGPQSRPSTDWTDSGGGPLLFPADEDGSLTLDATTCPKCGIEQPNAHRCLRCGNVFDDDDNDQGRSRKRAAAAPRLVPGQVQHKATSESILKDPFEDDRATCVNCARKVPSNLRTCPRCGADQDPDSMPTCKECGGNLELQGVILSERAARWVVGGVQILALGFGVLMLSGWLAVIGELALLNAALVGVSVLTARLRCSQCQRSSSMGDLSPPQKRKVKSKVSGLYLVLVMLLAVGGISLFLAYQGEEDAETPEYGLYFDEGYVEQTTESGTFQFAFTPFFELFETIDHQIPSQYGVLEVTGVRGFPTDNSATVWYFFVNLPDSLVNASEEVRSAAAPELTQLAFTNQSVVIVQSQPREFGLLSGNKYRLLDINAREGAAVVYAVPVGLVSVGFMTAPGSRLTMEAGNEMLESLSYAPQYRGE